MGWCRNAEITAFRKIFLGCLWVNAAYTYPLLLLIVYYYYWVIGHRRLQVAVDKTTINQVEIMCCLRNESTGWGGVYSLSCCLCLSPEAHHGRDLDHCTGRWLAATHPEWFPHPCEKLWHIHSWQSPSQALNHFAHISRTLTHMMGLVGDLQSFFFSIYVIMHSLWLLDLSAAFLLSLPSIFRDHLFPALKYTSVCIVAGIREMPMTFPSSVDL